MNTRKFSNAQEKYIAKTLGGKKQANSGATPFQKGDVKLDKFLIEAKTTTTAKESFTVKKTWLEKNKEEAFAMGKPHSVLAFNFGENRNKSNFYIIDEGLMMTLVELINKGD